MADQCVSLSGLVTAGYLGTMPISSNGAGPWNNDRIGYYISRNDNNSITVGACDAEKGSRQLPLIVKFGKALQVKQK